MPKTVIPLTATQVKNTRPANKVYKRADGGGLYLRVLPSGKKTWELRVTVNGVRKTLYRDAEGMTLARARAWRDETRGRALSGEPLSAPPESAFARVFAAWHERWREEVSGKYAKQVQAAVEKNVLPVIGHIPVAQLHPVDIVESLKSMESRGVLEYLKRTKSGVKLALDFAVSRGLIDFNPAAAVTAQAFRKHSGRPMRALAPEQLPVLIGAIERAKVAGRITVATYCVLYWQLITMCRPGEAAAAEWVEIEKDLWTIPASRMKAGRPHAVPLPPPLMDMLDFLRSINRHGIYLFEGVKGPLGRETVRMALKRMDIDSTAHGLRSLARTSLSQSGKFRREALESCLAHAVGSRVERAYNRDDYLEERREILAYWPKVIETEKTKARVF